MDGDHRPSYWPQLLLIAAAAANLIRIAEPLKSSRPTEPPPQDRRTISDPDIEARLWQDPFEAVALRDARFPGSKPAETIGSFPAARYALTNLVGQMQWFARNDTYENQVTVLAVMVPGNTYSEGVELRLRARYAVLAGLIECGTFPQQSEFIGQVQVPWARSGALHPETGGDRAPLLGDKLDGRAEWLNIPYEWLTGRVPVQGQGTNQLASQAVLVLWLREESFADYPKLRLAQLLGRLREDFYKTKYKYPIDPKTDTLRLRILGPSQSSTLIRMLEMTADYPEWRFASASGLANDPAEDPPWAVAGRTVAEVLRGQGEGKDTQFICATATAADEVLAIPPEWDVSRPLRRYVQDRFASNGLIFESTCTTDRKLLDELLLELERRGVEVGAADPPVAVLTEYDSFYGRVMAETFTNRVALRQAECGVTNVGLPMVLHYLRGVDGRVAGETERKGDKPEKKDVAPTDRTFLELPEGRSQLDYIPRLVQRLRTMAEHGTVKAIGILGSDVYDKLLLLQSLRHEFPEVIFFTTELDARLFHARELAWSRNLLVASSYGLQLENKLQGKIPPFRDSSQTALFVACLRAMSYRGIPHYVPESRLFEVGRLEPVDISVTPSHFHPSRPGLVGKPDAGAWKGAIYGAVLLPLLLATLAPISPSLRRWLRILGVLFGSLVIPLARRMIRPPFNRTNAVRYSMWAWLLLLLMVALLVCVHFNHFTPEGEVFSLWNGVSIWPSEILRLLGFYLSLGGLIYSWCRLNDSNLELSARYHLTPSTSCSRFSFRDLCCAFWPASVSRQAASISQWKDATGPKVKASTIWIKYLELGSLQNRLNRFVPPSVLYFGFGMFLVRAFGPPMVPYRGGSTVVVVDTICLMLFILSFVLVMFAVLDQARLSTRLIQLLADKPTDWGKAQDEAADERGMEAKHIDDFLDIRFIAQRTAALGSLIYFPFGLLALMVISRSDVFDRWPWPPSLLALFGLNSLFTLFSAISLKRTAARARKVALHNLRTHLLKVLGSGAPNKDEQAEQIRETMEEIQSLKEGAFAPLPLHPAVGAALLPFGGAGVVALLEYLVS